MMRKRFHYFIRRYMKRVTDIEFIAYMEFNPPPMSILSYPLYKNADISEPSISSQHRQYRTRFTRNERASCNPSSLDQIQDKSHHLRFAPPQFTKDRRG
jgi:hypothetical protein